MATGLRFVGSLSGLRFLVCAGAATALAGGAISASVVLIASERGVGGALGAGVIYSAEGAGAALGTLLLGTALRKAHPAAITRWTLPLALAAALAFFAAPTTEWVACAALAWGAAYTILVINNVTLRQRVIPTHLQGQVNMTARTLAWGAEPLGAAVLALLVPMLGLSTSLALCALPLLGCVALLPTSALRSDAPWDETIHIEEVQA